VWNICQKSYNVYAAEFWHLSKVSCIHSVYTQCLSRRACQTICQKSYNIYYSWLWHLSKVSCIHIVFTPHHAWATGRVKHLSKVIQCLYSWVLTFVQSQLYTHCVYTTPCLSHRACKTFVRNQNNVYAAEVWHLSKVSCIHSVYTPHHAWAVGRVRQFVKSHTMYITADFDICQKSAVYTRIYTTPRLSHRACKTFVKSHTMSIQLSFYICPKSSVYTLYIHHTTPEPLGVYDNLSKVSCIHVVYTPHHAWAIGRVRQFVKIQLYTHCVYMYVYTYIYICLYIYMYRQCVKSQLYRYGIYTTYTYMYIYINIICI